MNKTGLEKCLQSGDREGSAIVIRVRNSTEVSQLCLKGLGFGGTFKIVEKY